MATAGEFIGLLCAGWALGCMFGLEQGFRAGRRYQLQRIRDLRDRSPEPWFTNQQLGMPSGLTP